MTGRILALLWVVVPGAWGCAAWVALARGLSVHGPAAGAFALAAVALAVALVLATGWWLASDRPSGADDHAA